MAAARGPSKSADGPERTTSLRLSAPTIGARAMPSRSPAWRSTVSRSMPASRRAVRRGTASQVSRQPRLPHAQASPPSVPTTTCPISPAAKRDPKSGVPSSRSPAPTPYPTVMSMRSAEAPPKPYSASAAALASFATMTGVVNSRSSRACSASSTQPRLGALSTVPERSTMPGDPTPMPSRGRSASSTSERARSTTAAVASSPARPRAGASRLCRMVPSRSMRAPRKTSVSLRSSPTMRWPSRCRSTSVAGLPGRVASTRTPSSSASDSAMSSPTRSPIVTRVRPVCRARSARLRGPER